MARRRSTTGSIIATAAMASLLLAIIAAGGGCEIAIGNDIPLFECQGTKANCPGNQVCNQSSHLCVAPCSQTGCASGMVCDPNSNVCVAQATGDDGPSGDDISVVPESGPDADATSQADEAAPPVETGPGPETGPCRGTGCPCSGAASCDSGICADSATVPAGLNSVAGSFCTKPCCTSAECDAGTVCFAMGGNSSVAANLCVNPAWVQRSTVVGAGLGGATCGTGRDCRSGLCAGTTCADTCCSTGASATECAPGNQCRFGTFPGAAAFDKNFVAMCGHGGTRTNGQSCQNNSDCQSELCDGLIGCANACRNTGECAGSNEACAYVTPPNAPSSTAVAACFGGSGNNPGNTPEGGSCNVDGDCQTLFCDTNSHQCTDVCFADSDCTKTGWRCRPESLTIQGGGKFYVLACGP